MLTGIIGAMPEEIDEVVKMLDDRREVNHGMRSYHLGLLNGHPVVVVFSRWGKVAAAATVATLIHEFGIGQLLFTGVAGSVSPNLSVGDVVVGNRLIQHDMDARPLIPRFEIPLLGTSWFHTDTSLTDRAEKAAIMLTQPDQLHQWIDEAGLRKYGITSPQVHVGAIASGDLFVGATHQREMLCNELPEVLCVEMEGAAVAQVCYENRLPFTVIRLISDAANELSHTDFPAFVTSVAGPYSAALMRLFFA